MLFFRIAAAACLIIAAASVVGRGWRIDLYDFLVIAIGAALLLFPYVERFSAGLQGILVETRRQADRATEQRREAELAAKLARVYYSMSAVFAPRIFLHYPFQRAYGILLWQLAHRGQLGKALTFHQYAELLPPDALPSNKSMTLESHFEIANELAAEGLIEIQGDTPESARVRVAEEFVEPIKRAFAYLTPAPGEPSTDASHPPHVHAP